MFYFIGVSRLVENVWNALNSEENFLVSGGGTFDKTLKIWDLKKLTLKSECLTDSQITNIEFLSNENIAVSHGYTYNGVVIYNLDLEAIKADSIIDNINLNPVPVLDPSLTNTLLPSSVIFKQISNFEKHSKRILYMSKSRCNNYLSSMSTDGVVKLWKITKFVEGKKFAENSVFYNIR
jgi:WD40 repeat protein